MAILLVALSFPPILAAEADRKKMRFAADMARRGAWREATFNLTAVESCPFEYVPAP